MFDHEKPLLIIGGDGGVSGDIWVLKIDYFEILLGREIPPNAPITTRTCLAISDFLNTSAPRHRSGPLLRATLKPRGKVPELS